MQEGNVAFLNNYAIVRMIGRGAHGNVFLCYDIESNALVAVKFVYDDASRGTSKAEASQTSS